MTVQRPPILPVMHMPFRQTMMHGASVENERSCTSLPGHGESKDVFIPKTDESYE